MTPLSRSTKLMGIGIILSLGWFVLESCECDESKQNKFPGQWVACDGNTAVLMGYSGNTPVQIANPPMNFNPSDWDCKHDPNSPPYKNGQAGVNPPYPFYSGSGPEIAKPRAVSSTASYLPQQLRVLPFLPDVPSPAMPACDSTFPDVLRTDQLEGLLTRISTCPLAIKTTIPMAALPLQVAVTPDGSTAVVTSFANAVNFIDLNTNTVTYTLMTDPSINPHGLAISPDGTRAYITSFNTTAVVLVIDMASHAILATIPTISFPQGATLTPDGSQLWITSPLAGSVDIIDTLTKTHVTGLNIAETVDVAFTATGTRAYITSTATVPGTVVEVDASTYRTLNTYTVGVGPTDIKMSYGDHFLVVNNNSEGSVSVIDLVKDAVVTAPVGANPTGIVFVH